MDKSQVMAFVKRCLDELEINYDTDDDCIDITFESDDDLFPIQVGIFPYEDTITTFAGMTVWKYPTISEVPCWNTSSATSPMRSTP